MDCERVGRLEVVYECATPWERMAGDGARRFCDDCRREVFDLDRLTAGQIRRRLEAGRGQFCGRLTRQAGRFVPQPEAPTPLVALPSNRPRAAAVAAGLVTTWLGAVSVSARPAEPAATSVSRPSGLQVREPEPLRRPTTAPGATLTGFVRDEDGLALPGARVVARNTLGTFERTAVSGARGEFEFVDLPAGFYDVEATLESFSPSESRWIALEAGEVQKADFDLVLAPVEEWVTVGVLAYGPSRLRALFGSSELVVTAVAGASREIDGPEAREVVTELRIESVLRGSVPDRQVEYRRAASDADRETGDAQPELEPGTRVLAFLRPTGDAGGRRPVLEDVDNGFGVKQLDEAAFAAYLDRIAGLQRLERRAVRPGEIEPADLADWLVATVEEPLTRAEAIGEILEAVTALQEHASVLGTTLEGAAARLTSLVGELRRSGGRPDDDARPAVLGAYLVDSLRARLDAALAATDGLSDGDLQLYQAVRLWDEVGATSWMIDRLHGPDAATAGEDEMWLLLGFVMEIEGEASEFVRSVLDKAFEIDERWPASAPETTEADRAEAYFDLGRQVRDRLALLLESSP